MPDRSRDWLRQAERDLEHAELSRREGHHEWACFAAHQAAEKTAKAIHYSLKQEVRGHGVAHLLEAARPDLAVPNELIERARALDNLYIPPRYPNFHSAGAPFEHYGPLQSEQAIAYAREILAFGRLQVAD